MEEKETACSLVYGENRLKFSCFKIDESAIKIGNPYNTSFLVNVFSDGFSGYGEFECDIEMLQKFVSELRLLYEFKLCSAEFHEICYGQLVRLTMDKTGHIAIHGNLYSLSMIQCLAYEFDADQTSLRKFVSELESVMKNYK